MAAKIQPIQQNFNGGEISIHLAGRVDLDKYYTSVEKMENFIPLIQGPAVRRPGTQYIANALGPSRLIEFQFSLSQTYELEFGDGIMRFITPEGGLVLSGGTPYQIATPYALSELWQIKVAQKNDLMYIAHPNHPPMRLNRLADNNWTLSQPAFRPPPIDVIPHDYSAGSISLTMGGTLPGHTGATASSPVFLTGDIGKAIVSGPGLAFITSVTGTTGTDSAGGILYNGVGVDIVDSFTATAIPAGQWKLGGSPQAYFCLGAVASGVWRSSRKLGIGAIQTATTFQNFPADGQSAPPKVDCFRASDVGRYIVSGGATMQIVTVTSASQVSVRLLHPIDSTFTDTNGVIRAVPISGGMWSIEDPAYTAARGYPAVVAFFQDRLWFSGSATQPQTEYGSVVSDYENFSKGAGDDDGIELTINNGRQDAVQWLVPFQGMLMAGTLNGEFALGSGKAVVGGNGPPITPSDAISLIQSSYGVAPIDPILVENQLLYVQRARRNLFEMSFSIYSSVLASMDLNLYSSLDETTGAKEVKYFQTPWRTIWLLTQDGQLRALTYKKDDQIWGWSRHVTGASDIISSIGILPAADGSEDIMTLVVGRMVNGTRVWMIEKMKTSMDLNTDCASIQTFPTKVTSVSGMQYLAGMSVDVKVDNAYMGQHTVGQDGTVSWKQQKGVNSPASTTVELGIPYKSTLITNRLNSRDGAMIQGLLKKWNTLWIRVSNTLGLKTNGSRVMFRRPSDNMNAEVPPFTGDVENKSLPGNDRDGQVELEQDQPFDVEIQAIFGQVNVGEI